MPRALVFGSRLARLTLAALALAFAGLGVGAASASPWTTWLQSLVSGASAPVGGLPAASDALRRLTGPGAALAVHVTPEGHWQFVNQAGETFTAGTPAELKRAPAALMPGLASGDADGFAKLRLILSPDSLFAGADALKGMPAVKELLVAIDGDVYPLMAVAGSGLAVRYRPALSLIPGSQDDFAELLAQLRRPLDASRVRALSATEGAPATLASTAKFDKSQGGAVIDPVDPDHLTDALTSIPGQTAILTARLDGATATFAPSTGPPRTVPLAALTRAAAAADTDLVILHADPPRQPGGRTWLWQRVEVSGLDHAAKRATFADFLDALAKGSGPFVVALVPSGPGRMTLTARQIAAPLTTTDGVTAWLRQATDAVTGHVTGTITPAAIHANLVSDARRRELAMRLIPGLPSSAQALYLGLAALGLLAWPVARRWWRRLWPLEARAEYDTARGYALARLFRALAFVLVFLPLAALPAGLMGMLGLVGIRRGARRRGSPPAQPAPPVTGPV